LASGVDDAIEASVYSQAIAAIGASPNRASVIPATSGL
jgi:hypothetical protein